MLLRLYFFLGEPLNRNYNKPPANLAGGTVRCYTSSRYAILN
ncbi:hypothetical protein B602_0463 [Chlamydia psittaci M56]|nr:hypothetical protein B602_0463 [Chlamydia psittaci M56]